MKTAWSTGPAGRCQGARCFARAVFQELDRRVKSDQQAASRGSSAAAAAQVRININAGRVLRVERAPCRWVRVQAPREGEEFFSCRLRM